MPRSSSVTDPWKPAQAHQLGSHPGRVHDRAVVEHDGEDVTDPVPNLGAHRTEPPGVDHLVTGPHPGPVGQPVLPPLHDLDR